MLVDLRETKLAPFAHLWLKPRAGTDVALLNGLAKAIVDQRLFDDEFVYRRTENFEGLSENLKAYDPEQTAEITGVPGQEIQLAARCGEAVEYGDCVQFQLAERAAVGGGYGP